MAMHNREKGNKHSLLVNVSALLLCAASAVTLHAQTIQIKLVDGKTGHPVARTCVFVSTRNDPPAKGAIYKDTVIPVDKNGVARFSLTRVENEEKISYDPKLGCGGNGALNPVLKYDDILMAFSTLWNPSCAIPETVPNARFQETPGFSTREVIEHGIAAANTCGNLNVSPQPGEVILFVRPRNRQEKKHDCWAGELPLFCWWP